VIGSNGPEDDQKLTNASRYDIGPVSGNVPPNVDPLAAKFEELFSGRSTQTGPGRGDYLRHDLVLTLEEAVLGTEKTIRYLRWEICGDCRGSGAQTGTRVDACAACQGSGQTYLFPGTLTEVQTCAWCRGVGRIIAHPCPACGGLGRRQCLCERMIKVPAGVETDMRMVVRQAGDVGPYGGPPGDVHVAFEVGEHKSFRREGIDLYCQVSISDRQAAEGATILVTLLQGQKALKIPKGTQSGQQFPLNRCGAPDVRGRVQGNLYVDILVTQDGTSAVETEERKNKSLFDKLFKR
jgi:molecular chaperone DnaJ